VEASRQNLLRAEENFRIAREREEVGAVAPAEVLRAKVEVADARLALVRAESLVRLARGELNTVMGLPVETEAVLAPLPEESHSGKEVDPAEAIRRALEARPEIHAALHRIGAARGSVDAAKSAFGPRVRADARYGRRDVDFFPDDEDWAVGLALELPLFEGFSRSHNLSREKHNLSRAEEEVRHLILLVKEQVWAACQGLRESREALPAAEVLVAEAGESMRRTRERYEVGAATTTDLLAAQTTLARAELIAVESRRRYHDAQAVLDRAVGAGYE
jgi:outer membrane protein TolC